MIVFSSVGRAGAGVEVEVSECEGPECQTRTAPGDGSPAPQTQTTTEPTRTTTTPAKKETAPAEVHEYSLERKDGTIRTTDGEEEVTLDLSVRDEQGRVKKRRPSEDGDGDENSPGGGGAERQQVSTDGGSAFAGFGSGYDFVSSDEALSRFTIPPFLLPIYVAAGKAYGIPWNVLASINQIETDFGRIKRQVSYAGALGWMQFMPPSWKAFGVDATGDGVADPFNPVDAIYAAARYLKEHGGQTDLRKAVFAYNHADWYVDRVLKTASIYGSLPSGLVAETGSLAYGRFPLKGKVSYGDDFQAARSDGRTPRGLYLSGNDSAKAIATQDVKVERILVSRKVARALRRKGTRVAYGPEPRTARNIRSAAAVSQAALVQLGSLSAALSGQDVEAPQRLALAIGEVAEQTKRPRTIRGYGITRSRGIGVVVIDGAKNRYRYSGLDRLSPSVRPGAKLTGGQEIGRLERDKKPRMLFSVRAAGGEPVDPRPLVDGYRLQEASDFYHAVAPLGSNPFVPDDTLNFAGVVRGSQRQLAKRVLADSGIQVYPCGRQDISRGIVDRRVLGALLYLRRAGLEMTVTSLRCGHGYYTAGGSVSAHSYGAAVDIAAFNGQPVTGNQGPGSLTEQAVKLLMGLKDSARPDQLISLMDFGGPSFAMADHHDHLHVGYRFQSSLGLGRSGNALGPVNFAGSGSVDALKPLKVARRHERELSKKLGKIDNPKVDRKHGDGSLKIEGELPSERDEAERLIERKLPVALAPTAAGAQMIDVETPAGARGDEAWGLGVVDGSAREGWSKAQTVLLRHRQGSWRVVGPARDAQGRVINPRLVSLAVTAGGRGYAVGDRGHVVELRGTRSPKLVRRATKTDLKSIAVRRQSGRTVGYAVGARGVVVRLAGRRAERERTGSRVLLKDVAFTSSGDVIAVGSRTTSSPAVYRRSGGDWRTAGTDFTAPDGSAVRLTTVDENDGELWVGGAVADARSIGSKAEVPFAARLTDNGWRSYCTGSPALAAVAELGARTSACDSDLPLSAGESGPVADVRVTSRGTVLATAGGLKLHHSNDFRPVPAAPGSVSDVGLSSAGGGWALGVDGRMARMVPTGLGKSAVEVTVERLPVSGGGKLATVAVAPDGDRALALGGGKAVSFDGESWTRGRGAGIGVRDAAWASPGRAWAITDTGELLSYSRGEWSAPGDSPMIRGARSALADSLSIQDFIVEGQTGTPGGLQSVSFGLDGTGHAVGAAGLIARYDGKRWRLDDSPVSVRLNSVAVGLKGAVAVGDRGTLVERHDDDWQEAGEARALVRGQDFSAAAALLDGTALAIAAGTVIAREPDSDEWAAAKLPPLGTSVSSLSGYRDADGELHALALVGDGSDRVLLDGDSSGWRPVELPTGVRLAGADLQTLDDKLLLIGYRSAKPVAIQLDLNAQDEAGAETDAEENSGGDGIDALDGLFGLDTDVSDSQGDEKR